VRGRGYQQYPISFELCTRDDEFNDVTDVIVPQCVMCDRRMLDRWIRIDVEERNSSVSICRMCMDDEYLFHDRVWDMLAREDKPFVNEIMHKLTTVVQWARWSIVELSMPEFEHDNYAVHAPDGLNDDVRQRLSNIIERQVDNVIRTRINVDRIYNLDAIGFMPPDERMQLAQRIAIQMKPYILAPRNSSDIVGMLLALAHCDSASPARLEQGAQLDDVQMQRIERFGMDDDEALMGGPRD